MNTEFLFGYFINGVQQTTTNYNILLFVNCYELYQSGGQKGDFLMYLSVFQPCIVVLLMMTSTTMMMMMILCNINNTLRGIS